jgi:hypothetical protein
MGDEDKRSMVRLKIEADEVLTCFRFDAPIRIRGWVLSEPYLRRDRLWIVCR